MADKNSTIPKGWKMTTLGEVGFTITGKTPSKDNPEDWGNFLDFITPTDISSDSKYLKNVARRLSEEGASRFKKMTIPSKSVVVSCIGSDMGKVVMNENEALTNQQINSIKINSDNDKDFIFYLLKNSYSILRNIAVGGSTMPILNKSTFESLEFLTPSFPEQRAIAAVLSSLDDKIELLREQNKTLEAIAQAIFKEWFVNFNFPGATGKMIDSELGKIPEGWRVGTVKEIVVENTRGIAPAYSELGIPVINQRCIRNGTIIEEAIKYHDNSIKQAPAWAYLKPNDILIKSMVVGTLGRISQVFLKREKEYLIHSCITILRAREDFIDPIILGYYFKSIESKIELMGTGTTGQTSLNNSLLGEMKLVIPDKQIQNKLSPIFKNIAFKIDSNSIEIRTLTSIRDILLPKLMKGEIRVKGFKD